MPHPLRFLFASQPKIMGKVLGIVYRLLDEPSEGIAPVIVEQMAHTILKLKSEGLPVLLSEENLHFGRLVCDRAVIIEGGLKKFDGSFAELEAHPEIREAYLSV